MTLRSTRKCGASWLRQNWLPRNRRECCFWSAHSTASCECVWPAWQRHETTLLNVKSRYATICVTSAKSDFTRRYDMRFCDRFSLFCYSTEKIYCSRQLINSRDITLHSLFGKHTIKFMEQVPLKKLWLFQLIIKFCTFTEANGSLPCPQSPPFYNFSQLIAVNLFTPCLYKGKISLSTQRSRRKHPTRLKTWMCDGTTHWTLDTQNASTAVSTNSFKTPDDGQWRSKHVA
jgi:hypothetical protein